MKALVLWDSWYGEAGNYRIAHAVNALHGMQIETQLRLMDSVSPTVADMNAYIVAGDFDIVVISAISSSNRPTVARFIDGSLNCPVFCLGVFTNNADIKGVSASTGAAFAEAQFTANAGQLFTNSYSFTLDAGVSAPAETTSLVDLVSAARTIAWKYTPDASIGNYVYYTALQDRNGLLNLLVQEAINDGKISASDVSRAPLLLGIDHINAGGLFATGGGTELGGFQFQPDKIAVLGALLRANKGVCYTDVEQKWVNDNGTAPNSGTTTGELLANLQEYDNEFKKCATHDHLNFYTTTTTPWIASRTKTFMDNTYQATKTAIEGIGLTVDTTMATFAGNLVGVNWWELGSPDVSHTSSKDDLTVQAGYGFKFARTAPESQNSWPKGFIPSSTSAVPMMHWLRSKAQFRGITILSGRDAGETNNDNDSLVKNAFESTSQGFEALCNGTVMYYHHDDFEDVTVQPSGTSTGGLNNTYGLQTWQIMADYASLCPDTVDFGADLNNYL